MHGNVVHFFENGEVMVERNYENGVPDGKTIEYYPNGMVKITANYAGGVLINYKQYDSSGKMLKDVNETSTK